MTINVVVEAEYTAPMRVYVAGPITALQSQGETLDDVRAAFYKTADELRAKGYEPVVPFDLHPEGISWAEAMRADLAGLVTCQGIYYRRRWRESTGVKLERYVAKALGLTEMYEDPAEESSYSGSQRFHDILEELGQLHDRKQRDYGRVQDPFANVRASREFGVDPWIGAIMRANDKMARIKSFILNGRLENEPLVDSLRDLAVYAIIALVLREEHTLKSGS